MIIKNQLDVTAAVLAELQRADSPRFREIMTAAVRHLHDFAREARLSEAEFHQACAGPGHCRPLVLARTSFCH